MVNPLLEHLLPDREESFYANSFDLPNFGTPWHYHPEYELVFIKESSGSRLVGNAISEFKKGDLSLLGPNLPHLYQNSQEYYVNDPAKRAKSIIVHFLDESIGNDFLELPQAKKIRRLLQHSGYGLDITGETRDTVLRKLTKLVAHRGMKRLLLLIEVLEIIATSSDISVISGIEMKGNNNSDTVRLQKIFDYILQNYQHDIQLSDIAKLVQLTTTSFCRFFRERTKKTFFEYVTEVRLNHASSELLHSDKSVTEICFSCGFNNLSNFNRHFKSKYHLSPREFRDDKRFW